MLCQNLMKSAVTLDLLVHIYVCTYVNFFSSNSTCYTHTHTHTHKHTQTHTHIHAYYEIHSVSEEFTHTLSGFSANPTDDDKCSFLWFSIPEVSMTGHQFLNDVSTSEHGIKFRSHPSKVLMLNLMDPSQPWIRSNESTSRMLKSSTYTTRRKTLICILWHLMNFKNTKLKRII